MNPTTFKSSSFWTLCAGIAIGGVCMASIVGGTRGSNVAHAQSLPPARMISSTTAESTATLRSLDKSFANLAEFASPAVVQIKSESKGTTDMMGRMMPIGGEGSGVIVRPDGYIVTNDHVVGGFDKVRVFLQDGRDFPGTVMRAEDSDIAVVKIDAKDLPTLSFADSSTVKPGEFSIAIGSPFGFENTVTVGHISALGRANRISDMRNGTRVYTDLIQTDTPINMGNSGGPLINIDGQIIGINTSIYSQSGGSNGIGFAIPSNQARLISEMLIEGKKIVRGALGVVPEDLRDYQKKQMNIDGGAIVSKPFLSNGPAGVAGIKEGDVIVRVGKYPIKGQIDVRNSMLQYPPDSKVEVEYIRDGKHQTAEVKLTDPKSLQKMFAPVPDDSDSPHGNLDIPDLKGFDLVPPQGPDSSPKIGGKPKLGVSVVTLDDKMRKQFSIPAGVRGAVVVSVQPGSVAERIGMQAGDVIQKFGDVAIDTADQVSTAMKSVKSGDKRMIKYGRYTDDTRMVAETEATFK